MDFTKQVNPNWKPQKQRKFNWLVFMILVTLVFGAVLFALNYDNVKKIITEDEAKENTSTAGWIIDSNTTADFIVFSDAEEGFEIQLVE